MIIPNNQLPALAITSTYTAASQAAQLALTVQEGDVCVRTDENKSYIALNATNGSMSDWQELLTPTDSVTSVNGQTGVVSLDTDDISEGTNLYYTDTRVNTYLTSTATLGMLSDVNISSIADGEVITWSNANSRWENTALTLGSTTFVGLSDTPANYSGAAGYVLKVNGAGTAVEFNDLNTTDVDEGTNLYYTNARADARVQTAINDTAGNGDTTELWSADKIYDELQTKVNKAGDTMTGNLFNDTGYLIGNSTSRRTSGRSIEYYGSTSSWFNAAQDGTSRFVSKWNATYGASETFIVGGENAGRYIYDPSSPAEKMFSIDYSDGSSATAGQSITWTNIFRVGEDGIWVNNKKFISSDLMFDAGMFGGYQH